MIHHFIPYDANKVIGRGHNQACSLVTDLDDWIVLKDGDAMFLRPDWGRQIADVVRRHGNDYQVFGCLTNRLYGAHQLHGGIISDDPDISNHMAIANACYDKHYDEVIETAVNVAAMLMVFRKSTWEKAGRFQEGNIAFDRLFTDTVRDQGGRLAIMQGLYVFHLYRFGIPRPAYFVDHLM